MHDLVLFKDGSLAQDEILTIKALVARKKEVEDAYKAICAELKEAMENNGVKSFKSEEDGFSVTYVPASDRETFDKAALKKDMPDVYDAYCSFKPVSSSIRISVK
jgi:hypothetical protein